ncbi:XapX domain-containing protein [Gallaecimonas pentaromativorans]|uniref:XapX domain-containing protein n=1 Tax=Gallaecimonas pentaromativorans TaxID=584787 RepID=A0A3N1NQ71_9GAMM|nr:XapX domain-containing protein [Gallaecimonas pentaromativorans]
MQYLLALCAGLSAGAFFTWLKLPLPAPPTLSGIIGAFGVFLGAVLVNLARRHFGH